jgi:membrane associated rhomboid family serine protease
VASARAGFCYGSLVRRPVFQQFDRSQLRITRVALLLLFALVATSLVFAMSADEGKARMMRWLAPFPDAVWQHGRVWTLVTGPFLEVGMLSLVFQSLMVWMFLPVLERWWGPRRFLLFVAVTALVGTIAGTLLGFATGSHSQTYADLPAWAAGIPILGLDSTLFAAAIAFGIIHARAPVQFFGVLPMTGRQFMWGMIAVMVAFLLIQQDWENGGANLAASAVGAGMASGAIDPIAWWRRRKYAKSRSHLSVVPPPPVGAPPRKPKNDDRWLN